MSLVDLIEQLGEAIDAGTMHADDATQRLVEFSEAGLTHRGARDALNRHRTIRSEYGRIFDDVRDALARLNGGRS